jgi:Bacterial SH3 domain
LTAWPSTIAYALCFCVASATAAAQQDFKAPEDGGPRNWQIAGVARVLNLRAGPSTNTPVTATLRRGALLDNLGCRSMPEGVWCDVQALGGGPRGYVSASFLKPARSPDGRVATGPDDSALRAGQRNFDATGKLPCAQAAGQPMRECEFGVARAGGGYATIMITRPSGGARAIYFRMGRAVGADHSEADGQRVFRAGKQNDLHVIRIGDERYEIPDAVILGG